MYIAQNNATSNNLCDKKNLQDYNQVVGDCKIKKKATKGSELPLVAKSAYAVIL